MAGRVRAWEEPFGGVAVQLRISSVPSRLRSPKFQYSNRWPPFPCWVQLRTVAFDTVTPVFGQQSIVAEASMDASSRSQIMIGLNSASLGPPCNVLQ